VQSISDICSKSECAEYISKKNVKYASKKNTEDVSKKSQFQIIMLEFYHYLYTDIANNGSSSLIAIAIEFSGEKKISRKGLSGKYLYISSCEWKLFYILVEQPFSRINLRSKSTLIYY
jgi:hypothetical protein